jgi:hypothetical protein
VNQFQNGIGAVKCELIAYNSFLSPDHCYYYAASFHHTKHNFRALHSIITLRMEANNMNPNDAHDANEANNEANNDANIHAVYAVAIPASVPVANAAAALHVTDAPAIEANAPVVLDDLIASIREVESRKRFNLSPPEVSPITSGEVALSICTRVRSHRKICCKSACRDARCSSLGAADARCTCPSCERKS